MKNTIATNIFFAIFSQTYLDNYSIIDNKEPYLAVDPEMKQIFADIFRVVRKKSHSRLN
jgi:hypothetical protein